MAIGRFARLCGFSLQEEADIATAAGEALIAAAQRDAAKRAGGFSVTCTFENNELRIEIQSCTDSEEPQRGGFGTIIMRRLMNEVAYSRGGTRVRLVKRKDD